MKFLANFKIIGGSEELHKLLENEAKNDDSSRYSQKVKRGKTSISYEVSANDAASLRAMTSKVLSLLQINEKVDRIIEEEKNGK